MRCPDCGQKLVSRYVLSFTPELNEETFRDLTTSDGLILFKSKKKAKNLGKKLIKFDGRRRFLCEILIEKSHPIGS